MSLDLGAALAQSRRALWVVAIVPILASPAAAQVSATPTPPDLNEGTVRPPSVGYQGPRPGTGGEDPNTIRGFEFHTGVGVDEIFTDNARGVASGGLVTVLPDNTVQVTKQAKVSDLATKITPYLSMIDRTARLEAGLVYTPSFQKYALASDLDRFDNTLTATGQARLWREHLALNASASLSRQIVDTHAAVTNTGTALSTNQADLQSFILTPTFKQAFRNVAIAELQYQYGQTSSGAIAPATTTGVSASLKSGPDFNRFNWSTTLSSSKTNQGTTSNAGQIVNNVAVPTTTDSTSRQSGVVDAVYFLNRTFSLLGGFGYEEVKNGSLTNNIKGPIGNIGIGVIGARTELTLKLNHRYDSTYVTASGNYELGPQLRLQVSYDESVTTTQEQTLSDLAALRLTPNGAFADSKTGLPFTPLTSQFGINSGIGNTAYHDRMARMGLSGTFGRNTYTIGLTDENRTTDSTNFNETSTSFTAGLAREISSTVNYNLNLGYTNVEDRSPVAQADDTYSLATGFSFVLNTGLTASATYSLFYRRSTQPGQDIRENAFIVALRKSL
ncbi:MAG TPA: TIGR03016 family PEP-CTERM system-associated outer membrane protein [Stellaceae bacterium]|nr:TIGR03016 family PEP-CTERM system-associated outer membrane protein [Stellaceae bacterium]